MQTTKIREIFSIMLMIILGLVITLPSLTGQVDNWTIPIQLSPSSSHITEQLNTTLKSESPDLALQGTTVHVVFNAWPFEFASIICYRKSIDNGNSWGDIINLSISNETASSPQIAVVGETVHSIWRDFRNGNPEIYYRRSKDNGNNWEETRRLTFNSSRMNNIYDLRLVTSGEMLHITWKDYRHERSEVYYKRSRDNGDTWDADQRITYDYTPSYGPVVAAEGANVYIVWEDWGVASEVCYTYSRDHGETWAEKQYLTDQGDSENLDIVASNDRVYIIWQDDRDGNYELYYSISEDNGATWSQSQRLTYNSGASSNPQIQANGDTIHVAWQDDRDGTSEIYYKTSNDHGVTWSAEQRLTYDSEDSYDLALCTIGDNLHIAWQNFTASTSAILYMQHLSGIPTITSLNTSNESITEPTSIILLVSGSAGSYTRSDVECIIQYKPPVGDWTFLDNIHYEQGFWKTTYQFDNQSKAGTYYFRGQLSTPSGDVSQWVESKPVLVSIKGNGTNTPGFPLILLVIALCIVLGIWRFYKHDQKKKP